MKTLLPSAPGGPKTLELRDMPEPRRGPGFQPSFWSQAEKPITTRSGSG